MNPTASTEATVRDMKYKESMTGGTHTGWILTGVYGQ